MRNGKKRVINKALRKIQHDRVEQAAKPPESLWQWARTRQGQAPTTTPSLTDPTTSRIATTPSEKADLLKETFFPRPPAANLEDIEHAVYQITLPPIPEQEVEEAIREAAPLKAPGPNGITNRALQIQMAPLRIRSHLTRIFYQSLMLEYCPQHFRTSTTVALRKSGRDNYGITKSYRSIALLNTIGKVLDAIIRGLSYLAETHQLLSTTHMGGRKRKSTEFALHFIIDKIHEAWN